MIYRAKLNDAERAYNAKLLECRKHELRIAAIEHKLKKETDPDSSEWETLWEKRIELERILEDLRPELYRLADEARRSRCSA